MRNKIEYQNQKALFEWRDRAVDRYPKLKRMYAIPNGYTGDQTKIEIRGRMVSKASIQMNRMKATGLMPGVWDIHLPIPVQQYHGMYIEMKAPGEKLSDKQIEFEQDLKQYFYFLIAHDWIVARDGLILYLAGERF